MKQRIRTILIAVLCIAVSAALTVATFRTPTGITANFDPASYRSDVIVTAFQENWTSIAKECTKTFLVRKASRMSKSLRRRNPSRERNGGLHISRSVTR